MRPRGQERERGSGEPFDKNKYITIIKLKGYECVCVLPHTQVPLSPYLVAWSLGNHSGRNNHAQKSVCKKNITTIKQLIYVYKLLQVLNTFPL